MRRISLIFSLLFSLQLYGQFTISGNVSNAGTPLEFANVVLSDSNGIVDSDITGLEGEFLISADRGTYELEISFLGLSTWNKIMVIKQNVKIDNIIMFENANNLEQITISARKKTIEQRSDRLIFNVSGNLSAKGGNGVDVLRLAPGLVVRDGVISMIGMGTSRVMINGRLIQLEGQDLFDFVSSFSSEDISKVEIISNPPAQYEAAGNGGLVNIIIKKGARNSWNNNVNLSLNKNLYEFYSFADNFILNKNKVQLSASINAEIGYKWENEAVAISFDDQFWNLDMNSKNRVDRISPKLLFDYDVGDKLKVGIQYLGSFATPDFVSKAITNVSGPGVDIPYDLENDRNTERKRQNQVLNFHSVYEIDSLGKQVSMDLDYFNYLNSGFESFDVRRFNAEGVFIDNDLIAENISEQKIENRSFKLDFVHPTRFVELSYGLKFSQISTFNQIENYNLISGISVYDSLLSNEFLYDERTSAAYLSAQKKVSEKFDFQLGFRLERTNAMGISKTLEQANENDYFKLFPTLFSSYVHSEASKFTFSYGRRINRPGFRDLNPFRIYLNSKVYSEGNPFLQPSFSDNFSLQHSYLGIFSTNVFVNYLSNGYGTVFSADPVSQEQATIRLNFFQNLNYGISERINYEPKKWWSTQNQIFLLRSESRFNMEVDGVVQNGFQLYASSNHNITLSPKSQIQLDMWYSSPTKSNLFEIGDTYSLSISWNHKFLANRLNLNIHLNDIFNTASYDYLASEVNGVRSVYSQNYSSRHLRATVSYSFGNKKIRVSERAFGNEEERRRSN